MGLKGKKLFRGYLIKRIATTLITLFIILNFQFVFFWVINPIKPVQWIIHPNFTPELYERLWKMYGLDQPLYVQYFKYITNMLTLNFGVSFRTQRPVLEMLIEYLPNTLALVLTAFIIEVIIGVMVGLLSAAKRAKVYDFILTGSGLIMYAVPSFLVFLALRYIFAEKLRWLPIVGTIISPSENFMTFLGEYLYRMFLPLSALVLIGFGSWAFYTRNLSINILTQDFIQTAKAKGLEDKKVMFKHVLPVLLPPIVTLIIITFPGTIFGAIVCEYIFTWKGIGWWYLNSIWNGDYPAVQALFFIYTCLLLAGNFLADILYGYLDPRIRVGERVQ